MMKPFLEKVVAKRDLTEEEAASALGRIMEGQATEAQIAGLLMGLKTKGESVSELLGFAKVTCERAVKIRVEDPDAVGMAGTGAAAIVMAGGGVTVAKHGSADVLEALGVEANLPPEKVEEGINRIGIGFLFAPLFHPAMKTISKIREALAVRTLFDILDPMANPAGVTRHFLGAYSEEVAKKMIRVLMTFGVKRAVVVHSQDGLDEISVSAPTRVFEPDEDRGVKDYVVTPRDFGFTPHPLSSIAGGTKEENASIIHRVVMGEKGPARDVVVANAAMGFVVAGKAKNLMEGKVLALETLESGRALKKLKQWIEFTYRS